MISGPRSYTLHPSALSSAECNFFVDLLGKFVGDYDLEKKVDQEWDKPLVELGKLRKTLAPYYGDYGDYEENIDIVSLKLGSLPIEHLSN